MTEEQWSCISSHVYQAECCLSLICLATIACFNRVTFGRMRPVAESLFVVNTPPHTDNMFSRRHQKGEKAWWKTNLVSWRGRRRCGWSDARAAALARTASARPAATTRHPLHTQTHLPLLYASTPRRLPTIQRGCTKLLIYSSNHFWSFDMCFESTYHVFHMYIFNLRSFSFSSV